MRHAAHGHTHRYRGRPMNPIFALWWFMHRRLIDPEIVVRLSQRQRRLVWKQATAQIGWKAQVIAVVVLFMAIAFFFVPVMWFFRTIRQNFGPLGFLAGMGIGLAISKPMRCT